VVDAVVYVDSGSNDNSVTIAESFGVTVVELDGSVPFTASPNSQYLALGLLDSPLHPCLLAAHARMEHDLGDRLSGPQSPHLAAHSATRIQRIQRGR
jgi:hypothetical protein